MVNDRQPLLRQALDISIRFIPYTLLLLYNQPCLQAKKMYPLEVLSQELARSMEEQLQLLQMMLQVSCNCSNLFQFSRLTRKYYDKATCTKSNVLLQ